MKWEDQPRSGNVEDRRGMGGGGGFGIPRIGGGGLSIGGVLVALVVGWIFGINPLALLGMMGGDGGGQVATQSQGPAKAPPASDERAQFVSTVLADTENVWRQVFSSAGGTYREPKLVLFRGATRTACGVGQSAMGPFYCPADLNVYLDLEFFEVMSRRLGAPGDFAQAYVVAHEVGHHVQRLLGITDKVEAARGRMSEAQNNALSVRVELQADCLAGVWANHSQRGKNWLEQGDLEEAMNAAAQIGDDNLQKRSQGTVVPESFTHGTSAQRVDWFKRGFASGRTQDCDTFEAQRL